jgi:hypothetical protein
MTAALRPRAAALIAAAGAATLLTAGAATAAPAGAATPVGAKAAPAATKACTSSTTGITVVVDPTKLHVKVKTACDRKKPSTGLAALKGAGFSYTFVPRYPGFICTIDKLPKKCNGAPATAYWSYWHAKRHGKWVYSKLGAASYHPKAGSVEGWAFGRGKPPRIPPP